MRGDFPYETTRSRRSMHGFTVNFGEAGSTQMTPVFSGPEAQHHHNGEREQDSGNGNCKCECNRHGIPLRGEDALGRVNELQTQTLFCAGHPVQNNL
jgi:hypothetical protein